jgi:hypothetical protein
MLATMQRMLHKLTRSRRAPTKAKVIARLAGMRWRYVWAQAVQQLVDNASRSASAAQFPHPELGSSPAAVQQGGQGRSPRVAGSHGSTLGHSATHLSCRRAAAQDVPERPDRSPLFGGDPIIARRAATQLQRSVAAHPEP